MLCRKFGMSRQTAVRILSQLVEDGQLFKIGSTRNARYTSKKPARSPKAAFQETKLLVLKGLSEDLVFESLMRRWEGGRLPDRSRRILAYAFTEMLNNAIDHSRSAKAQVKLAIDRRIVSFLVRDFGIGIFHNIKTHLKLKSDTDALEHLLKGKQTTAPNAHSGQGIFFTRRIADKFRIRSGRLTLTADNVLQDLFVSEGRPLKGTEIYFEVKIHTRKTLKDLFASFADEEYEFDRTDYPIIILQQTGVISRSQGKRLTVGLDDFSRVILDFAKVKELGQGFADEIFRIYQASRPDLVIEVRNANAAVHFMIERAKRGAT